MSENNSYVYDPKSEIEKQRLKERDKRTSFRRDSALEDLFLPDAPKILDVGCGTGVLGFDLLSRSDNGFLVGIDVEPSILQEALHSIRPAYNSSFIAGDAFCLPFNSQIFEIVACQYVLQHLNDPVTVLSEMRRVSHVGATAIVLEWDDGINFTHPPLPIELQCVFDAKAELIQRRGGDRNIGRKLYHILSRAGWKNIEIRLVHDIWQGPDDRKNALKGTELSLIELKPVLINEQLISEDDFDKAMSQVYEYYCGDIFSVVFFIAGFAKNPG